MVDSPLKKFVLNYAQKFGLNFLKYKVYRVIRDITEVIRSVRGRVKPAVVQSVLSGAHTVYYSP